MPVSAKPRRKRPAPKYDLGTIETRTYLIYLEKQENKRAMRGRKKARKAGALLFRP